MMKKDIETNERIESFLKGTLSEEEMKLVRDLMAEDASFAQQVEVNRQLHDVITDSVYLGVRNELKQLHFNKMRMSRKIRRIRGFGAAGLIVGLAVVFLVVKKPGTEHPRQEDTPAPAGQQVIGQPPIEEIPVGGDMQEGLPSIPEGIGTRIPIDRRQDKGLTGREDANAERMDEAGREGSTSEREVEEGLEDANAERIVEAGLEEANAERMVEAGLEDATSEREVEAGRETGDAQQKETRGEIPSALTSKGNSEYTGEIPVPKPKPYDIAAIKGPEGPDQKMPDAAKMDDCNNVFIEGSMRIEVSCNNEPTGRILVDRQSLRGGTPPYSFSLDRKTYAETPVFSSLFPGNYAVYARDANGCVNVLQNAVVGSEDCTYEHVFAPMQGQVWKVPVRDNGTGTLIIYSKEGNVVYQVPVKSDGETLWQGETVSGQGLPMGLYPFEIRYDDGTRFIGTVTLVR